MSPAPVETPACQRSSGASARVACRPLLRFVQLDSERASWRVARGSFFGEEEQPRPALLLVVQSGRLRRRPVRARLAREAAATPARSRGRLMLGGASTVSRPSACPVARVLAFAGDVLAKKSSGCTSMRAHRRSWSGWFRIGARHQGAVIVPNRRSPHEPHCNRAHCRRCFHRDRSGDRHVWVGAGSRADLAAPRGEEPELHRVFPTTSRARVIASASAARSLAMTPASTAESAQPSARTRRCATSRSDWPRAR